MSTDTDDIFRGGHRITRLGPPQDFLASTLMRRPVPGLIGRASVAPVPEYPALSPIDVLSVARSLNLFGRIFDETQFNASLGRALSLGYDATGGDSPGAPPVLTVSSSLHACAFAIASIRCTQVGDMDSTLVNFKFATEYVDRALDEYERPNQAGAKGVLSL